MTDTNFLQGIVTPKGSIEREKYFSQQAVSISKLAEHKDINEFIPPYVKANMNIIRDEYRMLEAMHKEFTEKQSIDTNENVSNEADLAYLKQTHLDRNPHHSNQHQYSTNKCSNFYEYIPKRKINNISKNMKALTTNYILPHFNVNQPKELFLTEILKITVAYQSRIVILFDAPDDWNDVIARKELTEKDDTKNSADNDQNCDSNNFNFDRNTKRNSDNEKVFESDITMAVESEETDEKNETVVTWLRLQLDRKNDKNYQNESYITNVNQDKVTDKIDKFEPTINVITDTGAQMGDEDVYGYRVALIRYYLCTTYMNTKFLLYTAYVYIRCIPIYRYNDQYNRFSGWTRGTAPQEDKWSEFWKLYMRCKFCYSDIHT